MKAGTTAGHRACTIGVTDFRQATVKQPCSSIAVCTGKVCAAAARERERGYTNLLPIPTCAALPIPRHTTADPPPVGE